MVVKSVCHYGQRGSSENTQTQLLQVQKRFLILVSGFVNMFGVSEAVTVQH